MTDNHLEEKKDYKVDVSIVMPVYNAEKTVGRALDSILKQTWTNFETIIVNDGSQDGSLNVCEEYASKDERIKVFSQTNAGPSAARNTGLLKCTGKYLMCVDSDDVLHENALECLINKMESTLADVCIFAWNTIEIDGSIVPFLFGKDAELKDKRQIIRYILHGNYRCGGGNPWNKIWRLDSLKKKILFDETIRVYEDMLWTLQNLDQIETIVFETQQLYDYYILDGSISRGKDVVQTQQRFYKGAKRVYKYVVSEQSFAKAEAEKWYRDRFSIYQRIRWKSGVAVEPEESREFKKFSLFPLKNENLKMWLLFIAVRFMYCK